ncbi:kremen protein 2 [Dendrobates tinctorius]|uniref:kremen protein 2 n=1 Tax=Dendrobates tinctorius TaxID=92724 RepID=UPI003CC942C9
MLVWLLGLLVPVMSEPSTPVMSECFTVNGRDYRGSMSRAGAEMIPCLYWNQTVHHRYNAQSDPSGETGLGDHNYCRNPDSDVQPWCYVSETEDGVYWKYCDIPSCHMPGYVGCFMDRGSPPALSGAGGTSRRLTIQTCIQYCRRKGHEYAGVEAGYACLCGSSTEVAALEMANSSQCDQVCFGRTSELCGGDGKISVYSDPNDILEVKDGDSGNLLLRIRGGQDPPDIVTFQTDHLQISFQSDGELSGSGYVLLYRGLGSPGSSQALYSQSSSSPRADEGHPAQSSELHVSKNAWLLMAAGVAVLLLVVGYVMWRYPACGRHAPLLGWGSERCSWLYRHKVTQSGDLTCVNQSSMKSLL